ncbi:MAG: alkaline phosphatase family protein [Oscillospiraceae bacterium]|nr:alkaline phosphatase family protein [Oscillospiraceae bacterium]
MRTLLILVDGMRPDALTNIPTAQKIIARAKSTMSARTVMPSVTLPCHVSLFHSVDPARHGIMTNTYVPQVRPINGLCEVLSRANKSCAFFYNWHELRDLVRPGSLTYSCYMSGGRLGYDKVVPRITDHAIEFLNENPTDFTFLYYGYPDAAGHNFGWMGEKYLESVKICWDNIEKAINALPDDYTVIITADHGGHDRTHGSDMDEDMIIPLILLGSAADKLVSLENANIKDIAPTVTALLGVQPDREWEGKSLI